MIKLYYINLDRVPERRKFMEKQFLKQGLNVKRLSAIDALVAPRPVQYSPNSWLDRWSITDSMRACFESHRLAWRSIRDSEYPHGLVMEDDIILSKNFAYTLKKLTNIQDIDVIKIDGITQKIRLGPIINHNGTQIREIRQAVGSAAAYIISRESASKLESWAAKYCDHPDDFIFKPRHNWKSFQLDPAIAVQMMFLKNQNSEIPKNISNSERSSNKKINKKINKGPLFYRFAKEVKRSRRKLYWSTFGDKKLLRNGGIIQYPNLDKDLEEYL